MAVCDSFYCEYASGEEHLVESCTKHDKVCSMEGENDCVYIHIDTDYFFAQGKHFVCRSFYLTLF